MSESKSKETSALVGAVAATEGATIGAGMSGGGRIQPSAKEGDVEEKLVSNDDSSQSSKKPAPKSPRVDFEDLFGKDSDDSSETVAIRAGLKETNGTRSSERLAKKRANKSPAKSKKSDGDEKNTTKEKDTKKSAKRESKADENHGVSSPVVEPPKKRSRISNGASMLVEGAQKAVNYVSSPVKKAVVDYVSTPVTNSIHYATSAIAKYSAGKGNVDSTATEPSVEEQVAAAAAKFDGTNDNAREIFQSLLWTVGSVLLLNHVIPAIGYVGWIVEEFDMHHSLESLPLMNVMENLGRFGTGIGQVFSSIVDPFNVWTQERNFDSDFPTSTYINNDPRRVMNNETDKANFGAVGEAICLILQKIKRSKNVVDGLFEDIIQEEWSGDQCDLAAGNVGYWSDFGLTSHEFFKLRRLTFIALMMLENSISYPREDLKWFVMEKYWNVARELDYAEVTNYYVRSESPRRLTRDGFIYFKNKVKGLAKKEG